MTYFIYYRRLWTHYHWLFYNSVLNVAKTGFAETSWQYVQTKNENILIMFIFHFSL